MSRFWSAGLYRDALQAVALEHLAGFSQLSRMWRPQFEANPGWNPGMELKSVILSSDELTSRDKRRFEVHWALASRLGPQELAREVRSPLARIQPLDAGEAAWRDLLVMATKDVRKIFGKRRSLLVHPEEAPFVPRVLDAIHAYLQAILALDRLRKERIEFIARRYRQLQTIAGLVEGPPDFADRHTEYSSSRS